MYIIISICPGQGLIWNGAHYVQNDRIYYVLDCTRYDYFNVYRECIHKCEHYIFAYNMWLQYVLSLIICLSCRIYVLPYIDKIIKISKKSLQYNRCSDTINHVVGLDPIHLRRCYHGKVCNL